MAAAAGLGGSVTGDASAAKAQSGTTASKSANKARRIRAKGVPPRSILKMREAGCRTKLRAHCVWGVEEQVMCQSEYGGTMTCVSLFAHMINASSFLEWLMSWSG